MKNKPISGGCYCQAVQYQVSLPVKWCAHCHCKQCRHTQAAAIVTWFGVDLGCFKYIKGSDNISWFQSSESAKRGHCKTCGTPLFFLGDKWKDEIHITRESTSEDIQMPPQIHVFYDRHVKYLNIKDDLKKYGGSDGFTELTD